MTLSMEIEKVQGGFRIEVKQPIDPSLIGSAVLSRTAVASTPRQAGIRAGELARTLIEAEFVETRNG